MPRHFLISGFILVLMASEGLTTYSSDPACTNDVDNTEEKYDQNNQGGCWILHPNKFLADMNITVAHEGCVCGDKKVKECKEACDKDKKCKGFVERTEQDKDGSITGKQYDWYSKGCEYATVNGASTCISSGCTYYESDMEKTNNWGNVGIGNLLGPNYGTHYCGCWRKISLIKDP